MLWELICYRRKGKGVDEKSWTRKREQVDDILLRPNSSLDLVGSNLSLDEGAAWGSRSSSSLNSGVCDVGVAAVHVAAPNCRVSDDNANTANSSSRSLATASSQVDWNLEPMAIEATHNDNAENGHGGGHDHDSHAVHYLAVCNFIGAVFFTIAAVCGFLDVCSFGALS